MKIFNLLLIPIFIALNFSMCKTQIISQTDPVSNQENTEKVQTLSSDSDEPELLNDYFVKEKTLSFNDFEVIKLSKKVELNYPSEMNAKPLEVEVSYAVLKKNNKTIATFDGVYSGAGNAIDFGLFPFLGKNTKQLVVSQTIPRGGRHWIVDFTNEACVIFDSRDYNVGREEFSVIDIDKDGIYEISLPITEFYMFENMSMAETPLPEIIFKYDNNTKKYLPANPAFHDYLLNGIENEMKQLDANENNYLSKRLEIFLRYIYAGKENEAWQFFDKEYKSSDKTEIKSKLRSALKKEKVYKFIYRNRK